MGNSLPDQSGKKKMVYCVLKLSTCLYCCYVPSSTPFMFFFPKFSTHPSVSRVPLLAPLNGHVITTARGICSFHILLCFEFTNVCMCHLPHVLWSCVYIKLCMFLVKIMTDDMTGHGMFINAYVLGKI